MATVALVLAGIALISVAIGLRLHCLECRGLWLDEVLMAQTIRYEDFGAALGWIRIWVDHTPFAWLITWLMRDLGGSEIAVRLPHAVASVLTVPAMFWLGTLVGGRLVGISAAAFLAVSPYAVFYAQEARVYAWLMLFSTLAMALAYRAAIGNQRRDWLALSVVVALALYTSYLGFLTLAAVYAFAAVAIVRAAITMPSLASGAFRSRWQPGLWAVGSLALAGALFVPWLSQLRAFLSREDLGLSRFPASGGSFSMESAVALLRSLDFTGVMLALLVVGCIASAFQIATPRWRGASLALLWLLVPVSGFAVRFGPGTLAVWDRYWSIVHPAAILLAGIGAVHLVALAARILRVASRRGPECVRGATASRTAVGVGMAAVIAIGVVQLVPSTLATYDRVKGDDFRGGAERIVETAERPLILTAGTNAHWLTWGLDYYLWLLDTDASVVPAADVSARHLTDAPDAVWLAAYPQYNVLPEAGGSVVEHPFTGYHLYRAEGNRKSIESQATELLAWSETFAPSARQSLDLLRALSSEVSLGPDLVPDPGERPSANRGWSHGAGIEVTGGGSGIRLNASGGEVNSTFATTDIVTGATYVLEFDCLAVSPLAGLHVFVTAHDASGAALATFPDGAGYRCRPGPGTNGEAFAFIVPSGTSSVTVWFRASGNGSGSFDRIALRAVDE